MSTKNNLGKSMYFASALPATNDAAGFEALSWTKVEGYQGGIQFGFEAQSIDVPDLESGITSRMKGPSNGASSTLSFHGSASATNPALLKVLADSPGGVGSVKIGRAATPGAALAEGDPVEYAQGFYHSFMGMEQTDTSHEGFTVTFQQNAPHVTGTEPA